MVILHEPTAAAEWSAAQRRAGRTVGAVPTMGALHAGHLHLVDQARAGCGAVIASIFVNPLQFNDPEDLRKYPRDPEGDAELLRKAGCNALFMPTAEAIYAGHRPRTYDLGGLDAGWEGAARPGHFQGVVNVVERLFHYMRPDRAYFGEKDRQQLTIIRHVAGSLHWPEHIVPVATVREPDGLAMSSRNQRLAPADRARAPQLYQALQAVARNAFHGTVAEALAAGRQVLEADRAIHVDHLAVVGTTDLRPVEDWAGVREAVVLVAARIGEVRLIDNITVHR
jgi:pantoate--beta-alanine ligase